jgi:DNA-binding beta-propeller fold protein YncE
MSGNSKSVKSAAIALMQIALVLATAIEVSAADTNYELKPITLPGASGPVALDYFVYDATTGKLWVPASNIGSVDVIDEKTDSISQITGFPTGEIERRGRKITVGPTSASIGDGVIYIGDRGDATVCVVDVRALERGECVPASPDHSITPDGVLYVAATKEVWITARPVFAGTPDAARAVHVFDATDPRHLKWKTKIPLDGLGEGYAVDNARGLFYTNVEGPGATVAIDARTKKIVSKWNPGSAEVGGLALDPKRGFLFVACGDHVVNLDAAHDGKVLDSIHTGVGLDNIDFSPEEKLLYAASGAATLTIAEVDDHGKFHLRATVPTVKGARSVVAGKGETAYLIDPAEGRMLKLMRRPGRSISHFRRTNRFAD